MNAWKKRPSAAFVVAMIALFVALGGTAGAVVSAAVPLAKRALVADNAKKLGGLFGSATASSGTYSESIVYSYQGSLYHCSSGVISWSATLQG